MGAARGPATMPTNAHDPRCKVHEVAFFGSEWKGEIVANLSRNTVLTVLAIALLSVVDGCGQSSAAILANGPKHVAVVPLSIPRVGLYVDNDFGLFPPTGTANVPVQEALRSVESTTVMSRVLSTKVVEADFVPEPEMVNDHQSNKRLHAIPSWIIVFKNMPFHMTGAIPGGPTITSKMTYSHTVVVVDAATGTTEYETFTS